MTRLGDLGGPSVVREMDERGLKGNNLVFHRVTEAEAGDAKMRVDHDKVAIQHLMMVMGVELDVETATKTVRRLGARGNDGEDEGSREPRPLLVGFVHYHHTEAMLENSWKLARAEEESTRAVSVVKDLTMRQRAAEKEMYRQVSIKNLDRSGENISANLVFKVVGKRGFKREILAPLRDGEYLSEEGEVRWDRGEGASNLPGRGPARGGGRPGPSSATYPNWLALGRRGGGRGQSLDRSLGTALGQRGGHTTSGRGRGGGGGVKRSVEGEDGWTGVGRGARSGDSRSPPVKKPDIRSSPTSSKGSQGIQISPNKYSPLAGEEEEEEDENNRRGGDNLDGVEYRVVGAGQA